MNSPRTVALAAALVAGLASAAPLAAQEEQPRTGKIHDVEEQADGAPDASGLVEFLRHAGLLLRHLVPLLKDSSRAGQGYLAYPYQDPRALEHFVLQDVRTHREFGNLSATYFRDAGSTLRGLHVAFEGAHDVAGLSAEYDYFREPTSSGTDHLHLARLGVAGIGRLSHAAYLRTGLALRAMALDDGRIALGPEGEVGLQVFPLRPLAFDGTFRIAGLTGAGAAWFGTALIDAAAGAGVLVGRVELRGGYRLLVIGNATTLAGPSLGARIWF